MANRDFWWFSRFFDFQTIFHSSVIDVHAARRIIVYMCVCLSVALKNAIKCFLCTYNILRGCRTPKSSQQIVLNDIFCEFTDIWETVIWENGINKRGSEYSVKETKVASRDFLIVKKKKNIFDNKKSTF